MYGQQMLMPPDYESFARVVVEEGITVVETAGHYKGLEPFVKLFKEHGITIIHKCTAIRHAKTAEKMGVDMVCLDGFGAAGHPGLTEVDGWVLFTKAQQELSVPWLACGGCATGAQLAAALTLGASGMTMGTRFLAVEEAFVHANVKKAIVEADENSTTLIMKSMRNTERVFKNKAVQELQAIEAEFPGDFDKVKHLVSGRIYKEVFQETGDVEAGVWSAGESLGLINDVPTTKNLIDTMVADALASVQRSNSCLV